MAVRKVSARQSTKQEKSDQQEDNSTIDRTQAENLAVTVAAVLKNPACPDHLRAVIEDALCELQSRSECLTNVDFLMGLFLSKPRQAEGGAQ